MIEFADDNHSLTWAPDGTYDYSVQSNSMLQGGSWDTFEDVTGTPPHTTVVLPPKDGESTFYRVIVE